MTKNNSYTLDYNFAGLDKSFYGKTYPNEEIISEALDLDLKLETGSDAHKPEEVGRHFIERDE